MGGVRYLDLFVSESRERLTASFELLGRLVEAPLEIELHRGLMRQAHSLKGMAATMGYVQMVGVAHAMEDLFDARNAPRAIDTEAIRLLEQSLNCLGRMIDRAEDHAEPVDAQAEELAFRLRQFVGAPASVPVARRPEFARSPGVKPPDEDKPTRWRIAIGLSTSASLSPRPTVAVLTRLGRLGRIEHVSPVRVGDEHGRFDGRLTVVLDADVDESVLEAKLLAMTEIDAFEISEEPREKTDAAPGAGEPSWARVRADLLDDVVEQALELIFEHGRARAALERERSEPARDLDRSELLLKRLYETLTELRLMPFESVSRRMHGWIAPLAQELGKSVRLVIHGSEVCLDRSLLDALVDPLQHMVRNAVDHGVESADERRSAGKPETATIELRLERRNQEVSITVRDDGRGLCPQRLRQAAVERGLLTREQARGLSESETFELITQPGFTTLARANSVSGRGVGMDAVRADVERLGGQVRITSTNGTGTSIELSLPIDVALIQALLVRCSGDLFAIPVTALRRTLDLDETLPAASGNPSNLHPELQGIELARLGERLGISEASATAPTSGAVLVLRTRQANGLVVDEIVGRREIVVKALHEPLAALRQYSGAALLEDGSIALVVDPYQLPT